MSAISKPKKFTKKETELCISMYLKGKSVPEIAKKLNRSEGSIYSKISRERTQNPKRFEVKEKVSLLSFSLGAVLVLFLMSFPKILQSQVRTFKLGHYMQGFTVTQLYRPAVFELNSYQTFKIGNLDFNVPNYDLSFDTPQPSISPYSVKKYYEAEIFPQKISENVQDGFVWKKLSPEEKEKLKKIISKF